MLEMDGKTNDNVLHEVKPRSIRKVNFGRATITLREMGELEDYPVCY